MNQDGKNLKSTAALSQETSVNSGEPQRSVISHSNSFYFDIDLLSVINVAMPLFADDVKMVSPLPQSDIP